MPQGDKSNYSSKQKRKAAHIEESYEKHGAGKKEAERRAWATVNKQDGGAKGGSGRKGGASTKARAAKSKPQKPARKSVRSGSRSHSSK